MNVHYFDTTGEAYDACQWNDRIKRGDALVIAKERVVGMADAWPVAITAEHGVLHFTTDDLPPANYCIDRFGYERFAAARDLANRLGF